MDGVEASAGALGADLQPVVVSLSRRRAQGCASEALGEQQSKRHCNRLDEQYLCEVLQRAGGEGSSHRGCNEEIAAIAVVNKQGIIWKIEGRAPIGCPFDLNYNPRSSAKSTDSSGRQPKRQIVTPLGRTRPQRMNSFQSSDSLPTEPLGSRQQGVKRTIDETQKCDPDPGAVDALVLENSRLLTEAANDLTRLLQCCTLPVTRIQWASWLDANMVDFRRRMKSAFIERRKLSGHSAASLL